MLQKSLQSNHYHFQDMKNKTFIHSYIQMKTYFSCFLGPQKYLELSDTMSSATESIMFDRT